MIWALPVLNELTFEWSDGGCEAVGHLHTSATWRSANDGLPVSENHLEKN
jgi:hypothetical protein